MKLEVTGKIVSLLKAIRDRGLHGVLADNPVNVTPRLVVLDAASSAQLRLESVSKESHRSPLKDTHMLEVNLVLPYHIHRRSYICRGYHHVP